MKNKNKKKRTRSYQVGFRISPSPSGKYGVYLAVDGELIVLISAHYQREDAVHGANQCRKCFKAMGANMVYRQYQKWIDGFLRLLNSEFDYPDDSEIWPMPAGTAGIRLCL
jgi:hypothetical protein